ncbi:hypothetical protein LTR50_007528 [Elasticomyces elasticus]|nr:hypothetical protein LTR50_007528 [Elasticomyces elasticus]
MRGFTVSLLMLMGTFPALISGQLADKHGRLHVTMVGVTLFVVGAVLQGAAYRMPMFLVGRALCGLGEGTWLSCVSVYITEIAPSSRRGTLVSLPQLNACVGVCVGYFTCYGSIRINSSMSWRMPFVVEGVIALFLAITCFFLPESPRWLLLNGKRDAAIRELDRLDFSRVEAEKDLLGPAAEQAIAARLSTMEGFLIMFRRRYRSRTILALFVLGMVQLCGIDGVLYYAPTLFAQAGLPPQSASFLASGLSAILMLAISIPATLFSDRVPRRTVALVGGTLLAACMLIIGSLYAVDSVHTYGAGRWVVIVLIFAFALTYVSTWGMVGKIYASEIQPSVTRSSASALAQGLGFFTNFLVAITTPIFLANSSFGAYFLFGGLTLGTVVVLGACMPETRGLSLEAIQDAFRGSIVKKFSLAGSVRRWLGLNSDAVSMRSSASSGHERIAESEGVEMSGGLRDSEATGIFTLPAVVPAIVVT